jgi:general secretion pathway protein D
MIKPMFFICLTIATTVVALSVEQKLDSCSDMAPEIAQIVQLQNQQLGELKTQIRALCLQAQNSYEKVSPELALQVESLRQNLWALESQFASSYAASSLDRGEGISLLNKEDITLAELLNEYGPQNTIYLCPPELGSLKLHFQNCLPIPKESWKSFVELLLSQNGIGIKELNGYTCQLYLMNKEPFSVQKVVSTQEELQLLDPGSRAFYVFAPPMEQVKSVVGFFEKFMDPKLASCFQIGTRMALVGAKEELIKLHKLYEAMWEGIEGKVSKVVPISKIPVKEMEKILQAFFADAFEKPKNPFSKQEQEGLAVIVPTVGNGLILIGAQEIVKRAEKLIKDTQDQLQDPAEMTIMLYKCRHSNPEDLSKILEKVYSSLLSTADPLREGMDVSYTQRGAALSNPPDGYAPAPPLVVPPQSFKPDVSSKWEVEQGAEHFIADAKTGNLLMVVRRDVIFKVKEILKKLDVPKKMVEIEVLLFEKQLKAHSNYGLNLLKIGSNNKGFRYDGPLFPQTASLGSPVGSGVLEFLFRGAKSAHFPAYDVAYSFLMTQEDIRLNAAPSIVTVNQTPATISIIEEISINSGAAPVSTNNGTAFEQAYVRSQYGITLIMTPIIHVPDQDSDEDHRGFVTLQTNITFDTPKPSLNERPTVDKRHIENEVRVADGQTIILGGLRKKASSDQTQKVPFLSDLPGLGKLFGSSHLTDHNTEMFIFITPKIIQDPLEEMDHYRTMQLQKRPGDIPEFLQILEEAKNKKRQKEYSNTFKTLFRSSS